MTITRRLLLGVLAEGCRCLIAGEIPQTPPGARRYRVDATILLFSLPIFKRGAVGGGHARHVVESRADRVVHSLEFAAGSVPDRAHGLNRLGMIREQVAEADAAILEASYFGFMTASGEESVAEARKALEKTEAQSMFVAIEGRSQPGEAHARRARFYADARNGWTEYERLEREAAAAVKNPERISGENRFASGTSGSAAPTFLFAMCRAMSSASEQLKQTYVYSGTRYELTTSRKPDPRMGRRCAESGLACDPESVIALSGLIRNLETGNKTPFRIWADGARQSVPLRIEYQPRGFLQLALEALA